MRPAIVMPLHDPQGQVASHLNRIAPQLESLFERAYLSVTASTIRLQNRWIEQLQVARFFKVLPVADSLGTGEHFSRLFAWAVAACPAQQPLHLCYPDRVAFALETDHRAAFCADIQGLSEEDLPLIFQRSGKAWQTHPPSYRQLEQAVTVAGRARFGRSLDFAWCHLVIRAADLEGQLPCLTRPDISMVAQLVIGLADRIQTKSVDWLAWEDPFILGIEARQLRRERESSRTETLKRLAYVIPMLSMLESNQPG